jgi:hypothetical protein
LDVLSAVKKSIVVVKAAFLYLAMAPVNGDPKYVMYREGKCFQKPVEELLKASGIDLSDGGGLEELQQFQEYL